MINPDYNIQGEILGNESVNFDATLTGGESLDLTYATLILIKAGLLIYLPKQT